MAGDPILVIAQTDAPKTSGGPLQAQVIDLALMWMSKDWILGEVRAPSKSISKNITGQT